MNDPVNSPSHYKSEIECIDAMEAAHGKESVRHYCINNAFKYVWRAGKKLDLEEQDLLKAIWYLRFAVGDDPRKDK